jgi:sterol desaturase/sphingolipid hydroxylase (fatty acid hydroxylase superfamily)
MTTSESRGPSCPHSASGREGTPAPATQLSRGAFFADFYVYPLAAAVFLALPIAANPQRWIVTCAAAVTGLALWTLLEYLLHRFVLHHVKWVKNQHDMHHHDAKALVGTPTWFSFLVFLVTLTLPVLLASTVEIASGLTAGVMLGYLWYVTVHYGIHHWKFRSSGYLGRLKSRHALHHHFDDLGNFGVTSGLWDFVFCTNLTRRDVADRVYGAGSPGLTPGDGW